MSKQYETHISNLTKREGKKVSVSRGNVKELVRKIIEHDAELYSKYEDLEYLQGWVKYRDNKDIKASIGGYINVEAVKLAIKLKKKDMKKCQKK